MREPAARPRPRGSGPWLGAIFLGVLVVLGAGFFYYLHTTGRNPVGDIRSFLAPPFEGRERVNILILGVDSNGEPRRSDTMMVLKVNLPEDYVALVSVPRDLYVEIPGHSRQRINAAYALGGIELAKKAVEVTLGIPIDYYVKMTVNGLVRLVDAMGGVTMNVEKRMYYRDRSQGLFIDLPPGEQHLDGVQAMGYVRYRRDRLGDFTRMRRQHKFLLTVASQLSRRSMVPRWPRLIAAFLRNVETDLTARDIEALASLGRRVGVMGVKTAVIPGVPANIGGQSVLEPDWHAMARLVSTVIRQQPPSVEVVNASGTDTLGYVLESRLNEVGFAVADVTISDETVSRTRIVDHFGRPDLAKPLQKIVPDANVVRQSSDDPGVDFTIILGADFARKKKI
jgi:LCP family protein required for cell wall assembly